MFNKYFDNIILCLKDIIYFCQQVFIYSFAIILTILAIPFIWKIKMFIKHLIELFKTNNYKTFFVNYFNTLYKCILEIIYFSLKILTFSLAIIMTILATPLIWKLKKNIKNLIELFKTNDIKKFFANYFDNGSNSFKQILNLGQKITLYFMAVTLTVITIPFIWKLHQFIEILIALFKTKDEEKFIADYCDILINCFSQLYTVIFGLIIFSISIILTIIATPFIWNINKFIKNLTDLFKTKEYKQFLINYYNNVINSFIQILNLGQQIIIYFIAIILTIISIPFIWKLNKFIKNLIEIDFYKK